MELIWIAFGPSARTSLELDLAVLSEAPVKFGNLTPRRRVGSPLDLAKGMQTLLFFRTRTGCPLRALGDRREGDHLQCHANVSLHDDFSPGSCSHRAGGKVMDRNPVRTVC